MEVGRQVLEGERPGGGGGADFTEKSNNPYTDGWGKACMWVPGGRREREKESDVRFLGLSPVE